MPVERNTTSLLQLYCYSIYTAKPVSLSYRIFKKIESWWSNKWFRGYVSLFFSSLYFFTPCFLAFSLSFMSSPSCLYFSWGGNSVSMTGTSLFCPKTTTSWPMWSKTDPHTSSPQAAVNQRPELDKHPPLHNLYTCLLPGYRHLLLSETLASSCGTVCKYETFIQLPLYMSLAYLRKSVYLL